MYYKNVQEAWNDLCDRTIRYGDKIGNTLELNNIKIEILHPEDNIVKNREKFSLPYYLGENIWYGAGSNSMDFISKFGKIWEKLSDDGITNESAYGFILQNKYGFNQIDKIVELLKSDVNSRRAILNINAARENVIETHDEQCTIALQLLVRNGKLNMTGIMRSNDLWTGFPYDLYYFIEIQKIIAEKLGIEIGTYTHFVGSLHIYDRNVEDIKKSIQNNNFSRNVDIKIDGKKLFENAKDLYYVLNNIPKKNINREVIYQCSRFGIISGDLVKTLKEKYK